jgi:hypothetical protein
MAVRPLTTSLLAALACVLGGACAGPRVDAGPAFAEPETVTPDPPDEPPDAQPASAAVAEAEDEAPDPALRAAMSAGGRYRLAWRPVGDGVPTNEHFALEAWLWRVEREGDEERLVPLPGAAVFVSGWMPAHSHGMLVRPEPVDQGDGSYRVDGMLLHMRGHWQLFFDVIEEGLSERVSFDLEL